MRQRGVTRADIETAITNAHTTMPGLDGGVTYVGPGVNGNDLKVWVLSPGYVDEDTRITVKSVAWK